MSRLYVRFGKTPQKGDVVEGHGTNSAVDGYPLDCIPDGQQLYEYVGTVVEEEQFEEVKEAIVVGKTYRSNSDSVWHCSHKVEDGFLFSISNNGPNRLYWKFDNDGVSEFGHGQHKLILATTRVSKGKRKVLRVS